MNQACGLIKSTRPRIDRFLPRPLKILNGLFIVLVQDIHHIVIELNCGIT